MLRWLSVVWAVLAAVSAQDVDARPDYLASFVRAVPPPSEQDVARAASRARPGRLAARAALLLRVGRAADSTPHLRAGRAYLDALLERIVERPDELWADFHVVTPMARAAGVAVELGLWGAEERARLLPAARRAAEAFVVGPAMTHGNRDVSRIAGIATLAKVVADPGRPELWRQVDRRVQRYLDHHLALGDLDENAGSYASLGLLRLLHAVQAVGRERELDTPAWRATFERYRRMVAPSGRMPEWGDDYFKPDPPLHWTYLFEVAAARWQDARFARTARRMFAVRRPDAKAEEADLARAVGLLDLELLALRVAKAEVDPGSAITRRVTAAGRRVRDKLILRPAGEGARPMVALDLYCRGDHTHLDKLGAVTFYEVGGAALFTNYGRYRQSAAHANLVLATPQGAPFPPGDWRPGQWCTQSVPVERLPAAGGEAGKRALATMWLRNHPTRQPGTLWIDNLRLEGPAGVEVVDAFDVAKWGPRAHVSVEQDAARGAVLRLDLAEQVYRAPRYERTVDPARFSHLRYDVRYEGAQPPKVQARFPGGYDSWHFVGQPTLLAAVDRAHVRHEDGGICRGYVALRPYLSLDSGLERNLVLLADGTLVIRDDLHAGRSLDGCTAGSLWQMYAVGARGQDWFHAPAHAAFRRLGEGGPEKVRMGHVVRFAVRGERPPICGVRTIPSGKGGATTGGSSDLHTAFSSARLASGERCTFVTVVRPLSAGGDPAKVADGVEIGFAGDVALVRIGSRTVRVHRSWP